MNTDKRDSPIKDPSTQEIGKFVQIPIKDSLGRELKIGSFIVESENKLPGNPIVLFAPGDNETLEQYIKDYIYFCPYGVNFCVMDYRGRGYSEGKYVTYGENEIDDVYAVINFLKENGYSKISFFGRSRGAFCGVYAASKFPELVSVALDSPEINCEEEDKEEDEEEEDEIEISHNLHIPKEKIVELMPKVFKKIFEDIGIDFIKNYDDERPEENINQPIIVLHGINDKCIPFSNSEKLIKIVKSKEKMLISFKGGHNSYQRRYYYPKMFYFIVKYSGSNISELDYNK